MSLEGDRSGGTLSDDGDSRATNQCVRYESGNAMFEACFKHV